jgi:dynein heavy chain
VEGAMKIYVYTKIANPLFTPEIFIKLAVVNFTVTPEGLEDQLLAAVVENEIPEVETKKRELVLTISKGKLTLARN